MRPAGVLAVALATATVVACGGDDGDGGAAEPRAATTTTTATGRSGDGDPDPWSVVPTIAAARRGEVYEIVTTSEGGREVWLTQEWLTFDLEAGLIHRSIAVSERSGGVEGSREMPSLEFFYTADEVYMRKPGIEDRCGSPWVVAPPGFLGNTLGAPVDGEELLVVEALDVLAALPDPGPPSHQDETGSFYDVTVPGGTGLPVGSALAARPDLVERLSDLEHAAVVWIDRERRKAGISIDLSTAVDEVASTLGLPDGAEGNLETGWAVTPRDRVDLAVPDDVAANADCAGLGGRRRAP
jgi:hypothetical protein